jgi:hypothetical protein
MKIISFSSPLMGASGGIILAARESVMQLSNPATTNNTISASVLDCRSNRSWNITGVYGPQGDLNKKMFIRELRHLKSSMGSNWLVLGDFNLIYKEQDKNTGSLNRRMMLRFRRAINHLEIKEIELSRRKYTWSNR